ncbi:response regulator transcription factor [Paenibacillus senegalensis]|uniref:response regulator transcription factor n=1 Tax=Paenibacillus senegalensis TaxID=1465766 RepID=UPI000288F31C|nr:response regulator [Paenibacillus senegalensis]
MYRIIIADDEYMIREGIKTTLPWDELGCEVVGEAADGLSAWELIESAAPDIVLTDIRMPGMNGLDLASQVAKHYPQVRIIFLTGFNEFEYARQAVKLGAFDYVLKPTNPEELVRTLESAKLEMDKERSLMNHLRELEQQVLQLTQEAEDQDPDLDSDRVTVVKDKYDFYKIDDFLEEHYAEEISLQEVASLLHMSEGHFCRLFKKQTGRNFLEHLTQFRIDKAKPLLADLRLKMYEVAEKVGYRDSRYFSQIFRKVTGETPTDYRKKMIKAEGETIS